MAPPREMDLWLTMRTRYMISVVKTENIKSEMTYGPLWLLIHPDTYKYAPGLGGKRVGREERFGKEEKEEEEKGEEEEE